MANWKNVYRCKECGKVFEKEVPFICSKCGTEMRKEPTLLEEILGMSFLLNTDKCEKVIAKRKLFKWVVKNDNEGEQSNEN